MKLIKTIIIVILAIFTVGAISQTVILLQKKAELDAKILDYEAKYSPMYEYFTGLTIADFEAKVAKGDDFVVYFGRPDCGDCFAFEPSFTELVKRNNLQNKLYYVNVKWLREENRVAFEAFKTKYGFNQTPAFSHYQEQKQVSIIQWDEHKGLVISKLEQWFAQNGVN
ncbi:MAG: thioredoxin family protein [Culicoidibacterales bacterium]